MTLLVIAAFSFSSLQETYERSYIWSVNGTLSCPGNVSCNTTVLELSSPDYIIDTTYSRFELTILEASCQVENRGPQTAAFDVGVIFGPGPGHLGAAPQPHNTAGGVYRGAAFGWLDLTDAYPGWSIDFRNGAIKTWGAPVLPSAYNSFLRADGNSFIGSGKLYVKAVVWSGAPSKFELHVQSCSVHVVVEVSSQSYEPITVTQVLYSTVTTEAPTTSAPSLQLVLDFAKELAISVVAAAVLSIVAYRYRKMRKRLRRSS